MASSPSDLGQWRRRHHCALGPRDSPATPPRVQKCLLLRKVERTASTLCNSICSDVILKLLCLLACKPQQTKIQTSEVMTMSYPPSFHQCPAQAWHRECHELKARRAEYNARAVGLLTYRRHSRWTWAGLHSKGSLRQAYR